VRALDRTSELEVKHSKGLRVTRARIITVCQIWSIDCWRMCCTIRLGWGNFRPSAMDNAAQRAYSAGAALCISGQVPK
jgi:hypothetical protein